MKSESNPNPAGGKSRRAFVQNIGTAAAATTLAADAISAQQQPPQRQGSPVGMRQDYSYKQPGPLSKEPMPTMRLGKHQVGRLVLGVNPPGLHYSNPLLRVHREWNNPEQQMQTFKHCEELGINMRIQTQNQINEYNQKHGGKMLFSCNANSPINPDGSVGDPTPLLKKLAALGPIGIHYSAAGADDIWRRGHFNKVREFVKIVQGMGILACVNGHFPEMYKKMEDEDWGVDYYMPGLYRFGRTHKEWEELFKFNPDLAPLEVGQPPTEGNSEYYGGEIAWVRGDPPKMLEVIKQVKKPCIVFKILASGNLAANANPKVEQETVEARYKYVFENIKSTDGVVVGMWSKFEDQFAINKEYVVKYGGLSVKV